MTSKTSVHAVVAGSDNAGALPAPIEARNTGPGKKLGRPREAVKDGLVPARSPKAGIKVTPEILEQIHSTLDRHAQPGLTVASLYGEYLARYCSKLVPCGDVWVRTLDQNHITYGQFYYAVKKLEWSGAVTRLANLRKLKRKLSESRRATLESSGDLPRPADPERVKGFRREDVERKLSEPMRAIFRKRRGHDASS